MHSDDTWIEQNELCQKSVAKKGHCQSRELWCWRTFLKQRRLLFMLVLTLVLSTSIMFTACTPNIGGPSPEEIAAQKEAEEKKAARAPFVGVWEAKSISDPSQGDIPESVYPTAVESMKSIYGYDFADDGTGNFIRFGAQKPFTWSVDADGKLTITLAGNAGSYTATVDSSGQMTIEGSDGSKAVLKQISPVLVDGAVKINKILVSGFIKTNLTPVS